MEPGHEDREYASPASEPDPKAPASMEPGHEDREYLLPVKLALSRDRRLNGARS